ncbi:MAG: MTH1187 family thiamine-binding protein, partial [Candidatus Heimdallarchaeota archaeon]
VEGTSVSRYIKKAVKVIDSFAEIRTLHHPMGTIIEADDIDTIFKVVKKGHEALFDEGIQRVVTHLTIDDHRDKTRKMEDKVNSLK